MDSDTAGRATAKHILVVTTWFPDQEQQNRTPFVLEHVRAVRAEGHDVRVVHVRLRSDASYTWDDVEGLHVQRTSFDPRRPSTVLATWRILLRELRQCDVLHTMAFSTILVVCAPWLLKRRTWVHTEHWNGVTAPRSVGRLWSSLAWLRHLLRLPHRVTGVTTQLVDQMRPFTRPGAGVLVPCVVDPAPASAPFPARPPLRLVAVGLLNQRKDPLLALDTVAWLRSRGHDVTLTWVGSGPLDRAAREHAGSIGLADVVAFTGAVPPPDVRAQLEAAHLFFLPSHQENFFTAVAEAICAGRPAVVPLSGGFDDYCTPANSVLVASWQVEDLGGAVLTAADIFAAVPPEDVASTIGDRFSRRSVGRLFTALYADADASRV